MKKLAHRILICGIQNLCAGVEMKTGTDQKQREGRRLSSVARNPGLWLFLTLLFAFVSAVWAAIASIEVTPANPTIQVGQTQQFTATGTFSDGSTRVLTAANRAYVTNAESHTVSVIDTTSNTVVATVGVGFEPNGVAVHPAANRAYVVNHVSHTVSVIDTTNNTVVATVGVGVNPGGVAAASFRLIWTSSDTTVATINEAGLATGLKPGTTTITATSDSISGSTTLTVVSPNQPPDVSQARPSIATLWPPNHKFVPISILGVTDPDGDPVTITITQIRQDEPVRGKGDGNTAPDATGLGTAVAQLRAERSGNGNGRVYTIIFEARDDKGGISTGFVTVGIPHDQGKGGIPVNDGALFDST